MSMLEKITANWLSFGILFLLILLAVLLLWRTRRPHLQKQPRKDIMPGFTLIYADQKQSGKKSEGFGKLLYSAKYDLQGKPDYIFKKRLGGAIVPVELKSGAIKDAPLPHPGDLLQLAAYFLLLEDIYGKRPSYGWLKYSDYMFYVRNTRKLRKEVKQTMADMRKMLEDGEGTPNASFVTCRHCICNGTVCPYGQYHRNGGEV